MAQNLRSFDSLVDEIYLHIAERTVQVSREHETETPYGYYNPSQLSRSFFDLNQKSRRYLKDIIARDYVFIEICYKGCQEDDARYGISPLFRNMFQNAHHDRVLNVRDPPEMETSRIRFNIGCFKTCDNDAAPRKRIALTEVTSFASILLCNMLQSRSAASGQLGIEIFLTETATIHVKDKLRQFLKRIEQYICQTKLTYTGPEASVLGVGVNYIQTLTHTLPRAKDIAELTLLQLNHMREMHQLLSAGMSVTQLVPIAMWFDIARDVCMSRNVPCDFEGKAQGVWRFALQLRDNNLDIFVRGVADYLLTQPMGTSHFALSEFLGVGFRFTHTMEQLLGMIQEHKDYLTELQKPLGLIAANLSLEQVKARFKLEELYKTRVLINLALARLLAFPTDQVLPSSHAFLTALRVLEDELGDLIENVRADMKQIKELVIDPLDEKAGGAPYDPQSNDLDLFDQAGVLSQTERTIHFNTRAWLQHAELMAAAISRASCKSPEVAT